MLKFNHYCQHGRVASRTVLALFRQGIFDIATPHRRREGPSQYHILSHSAHTILAKASLSVLLALDDQVNEDSMQNYPLAVYAARYWVEHAQVHDIDYSFRETMFTANPSPPTATPLYYATLCGFRDLVQHLTVTHPGDINTRGGYHSTPLHAAVVKGNANIVTLLLEHGADVAALDNENFGPLYEASRRGRLDVIGLLLDHHADVNSRNSGQRTPLIMASQEGELEIARILLQHGAAVNSRDKDGWTSLMLASQNGHSDVVRLLLQNGATVDLHDNNGWTSLMFALQNGHLDIVCLLLQNGATEDSRPNCGCTSLIFASQNGHLDVVRLLLQNGVAVESHHADRQIPSGGTSPDLFTSCAVAQNHHRAGPNLDGGCRGTALHLASNNGNPVIAELLIQYGADVNSQNHNQETPLHLASGHGQLRAAHLLLSSGSNINS